MLAQPSRPVRLNRYGFVVDIGGPDPRWVRPDFHRPIHCRHELAQLLHPILCLHRPESQG